MVPRCVIHDHAALNMEWMLDELIGTQDRLTARINVTKERRPFVTCFPFEDRGNLLPDALCHRRRSVVLCNEVRSINDVTEAPPKLRL